MSSLTERFNFCYRGESTKRFHTIRTIGQNTVGEHSFQMIWLLWLLTEGKPNYDLLLAAMAHDMAEHLTGDMPAPTKRLAHIGKAFGAYEDRLLAEQGLDMPLSPTKARLLKLADRLSGMLFCVTERDMGNRNMDECFRNFRAYAGELSPFNTREEEVFNIICDKWESQ